MSKKEWPGLTSGPGPLPALSGSTGRPPRRRLSVVPPKRSRKPMPPVPVPPVRYRCTAPSSWRCNMVAAATHSCLAVDGATPVAQFRVIPEQAHGSLLPSQGNGGRVDCLPPGSPAPLPQGVAALSRVRGGALPCQWAVTHPNRSGCRCQLVDEPPQHVDVALRSPGPADAAPDHVAPCKPCVAEEDTAAGIEVREQLRASPGSAASQRGYGPAPGSRLLSNSQ